MSMIFNDAKFMRKHESVDSDHDMVSTLARKLCCLIINMLRLSHDQPTSLVGNIDFN